MKKYEEYKESCYDWVGKIPIHWKEQFLQQISHEQCIKNKDNIENIVLSLSYGNIIRKKSLNTGLIAKDLSTYQIVNPDNIILRFTDLQNDHKSLRTGLVKERGIITAAYTCVVPTINAAFLHYLLHSYDTRKVFYGMGGGVRQSIGFSEVRHMYLPVSPREEQDQIVRYLDWKVSRINHLIHGYQREIVLLKERRMTLINEAVTKGIHRDVPMQHTDSNWMGDIPAHWNIDKIKQHFHIKKVIAGKVGYDVVSITQQGLKIKDISTNEGQIAKDYSKYQIISPGEFAMNHMDLLTGYVGLSPFYGVTSPDYRVFTLDDVDSCNMQYYLYIFQLCYKRKIFYGLGRGAANKGRWRLPAVNFNSFAIPVPPLDEQQQIVAWIHINEQKINAMVEKITKQIELLKEYRTRLISDVVTGQVDVRGEVIPDYTPEEDTVTAADGDDSEDEMDDESEAEKSAD